jgi:hypothetical protein
VNICLPIVAINERATPPRAYEEQFHQAHCYIGGLYELRLAAAAQENDFGKVTVNSGEEMCLLTPFIEFGRGVAASGRPARQRVPGLDNYESISLGIGDATQHQRVRRREDKGIGGQRDGQQRRRERRAPPASAEITQRPLELHSPSLRRATHAPSRVPVRIIMPPAI